jgi:serine/threonine protein kinase
MDSINVNSGGGAETPVGLVIGGKYRLDARLGAGGMGIVYRAARLLIGDEVAVKILHPALVSDEQAAERFRREAQAAARLKHPNAVSVYDFGLTPDGLVYLVMELVEGESLRDTIKRQGPLMPSVAVEIARQVCAALDEAHRQGIVHRDVKPDNILVHETAQGLRVKVLDFGIARIRDLPTGGGNLTQTGVMVGTPRYMSPEQCLGEEVDGRSDIYSLGVVLFEMLAGTVPFNSPTPAAVAVQHATQPPPPLRAINMSVPAAVESVILRALEKRRGDRPQTAGALAEELAEAVSEGTHLLARPAAATSAPSFSLQQLASAAVPTVVMSAASGQSPTLTPKADSQSQSHLPEAARVRRSLAPMLGGLVVGAVIVVAAFAVWSYTRAREGQAHEKEESSVVKQSTPENAAPGQSAKRVETPNPPADVETKIVAGSVLSPADILGLSVSELRRLRNTVFARHGRTFESSELQNYFNSRPWYSPRSGFIDAELTASDRANIELLQSGEGRAGVGVSQPVTMSSASSSRAAFRGISYAPGEALDGSLLTAWIEGVDGAGVGEWVRFDLGRDVRLRRIMIAPGYFKSPQVWAKNNRVASATMTFSNGVTRSFTFPDRMEVQTLETGGVTTRWVQIRIDGVYYAPDQSDTAISEVTFESE